MEHAAREAHRRELVAGGRHHRWRPGPAGACRAAGHRWPGRSGRGRRGRPCGDTEARRREEIDALQRQDIADALKKHFNIDVDWRTTPLDKLIDIRVRAAKAADLQPRLGVSVDWQRYSWIELEALRRTLLSFEQLPQRGGPDRATPATPQTSAAVAAAGGERRMRWCGRPSRCRQPARAGRSTDPDGIISPTFTGRSEAPAETRDPDGVIRPTFAVRPRWPRRAAIRMG